MARWSEQAGLQGGTVEDNDDEEEFQYGFCQSRQATSFHYQDSSSLLPAKVMERSSPCPAPRYLQTTR
jgi:hypothetical protein